MQLSAREAMRAVQTIRYVRVKVGDQVRCGVTVGSTQAKQVLQALGIEELRPPTPAQREEVTV